MKNHDLFFPKVKDLKDVIEGLSTLKEFADDN